MLVSSTYSPTDDWPRVTAQPATPPINARTIMLAPMQE
jgi:hypothetical protein